jgi:hypothetical protein
VGGPGGGAQQRSAPAAAAACNSGEVVPELGNAWPGRLPRGPREV